MQEAGLRVNLIGDYDWSPLDVAVNRRSVVDQELERSTGLYQRGLEVMLVPMEVVPLVRAGLPPLGGVLEFLRRLARAIVAELDPLLGDVRVL